MSRRASFSGNSHRYRRAPSHTRGLQRNRPRPGRLRGGAAADLRSGLNGATGDTPRTGAPPHLRRLCRLCPIIEDQLRISRILLRTTPKALDDIAQGCEATLGRQHRAAPLYPEGVAPSQCQTEPTSAASAMASPAPRLSGSASRVWMTSPRRTRCSQNSRRGHDCHGPAVSSGHKRGMGSPPGGLPIAGRAQRRPSDAPHQTPQNERGARGTSSRGASPRKRPSVALRVLTG